MAIVNDPPGFHRTGSSHQVDSIPVRKACQELLGLKARETDRLRSLSHVFASAIW